MISIQTNVDSLTAQHNLNIDNEFQSSTIQQLTSGYRINKSGDDAAGLAVANGLESQITQLTQGVNNANNGLSQLQIVDGGLSNISTILNRLQTLATESASSAFTGDRSTLNQEYSGLIAEVTRQANNINLNQGGSFNNPLSVYIGGGSNAVNSTVSIDLSGPQNAVDALSLGLTDTNVLGAGTSFSGNTVSLNTGTFLAGSNESFTFNAVVDGTAVSKTIQVTGGTSGISGSEVLDQLNEGLGKAGLDSIVASQNSAGELTFSSTNAFNVQDTAAANSTLITGSGTTAANNGLNYVYTGNAAPTAVTSPATETLSFQTGSQSVQVNLTAADEASVTNEANVVNAATAQYGIYAVVNTAGTGIDFQSNNTFTVADNAGAATDILGVAATTPQSPTSNPDPNASTTGNADTAITAINSAIQTLGLVQGVVGAGENTLNYAVNLAQSQITNFSAAESDIKDADVAAQAANLSKSQVLTQTAVAALAQANSEPQAVLKLLQS